MMTGLGIQDVVGIRQHHHHHRFRSPEDSFSGKRKKRIFYSMNKMREKNAFEKHYNESNKRSKAKLEDFPKKSLMMFSFLCCQK